MSERHEFDLAAFWKRQRRPLLAVAAGVVLFYFGAWQLDLFEQLPVMADGPPDRHFGYAELVLFGLFTVSAIPLLGVLIPRGPDREVAVTSSPLPWRELLLWAFLAMAASALLGALRDWVPITDDADVYQLQARLLISGRVTEPTPVDLSTVANPFVVPVEVGGQVHWAGCYPLMAAVLTAPGYVLGFPNLAWLLLAPLTVGIGVRTAEELVAWCAPQGLAVEAGARSSSRVGRVVAFLLTSSPLLVHLASTLHTSMLAAVLVMAMAGLVVRALRVVIPPQDELVPSTPRPATIGVLIGVTWGLLLNTRPLEAVVVTAVMGVTLGWALLAKSTFRRLLGVVGGMVLGAVPGLALFLGYNVAVTGNPLITPYSLLDGGARIYGFGPSRWGDHNPAEALRIATVLLTRLSHWGHGQPLGLLIAALLASRLIRSRPGRVRVAVIGLVALFVLHAVAYVPAPFGEVATLGLTYSAFRLVPTTLVLALAVAVSLRVGRGLVWLSVFGLLTFLPAQASRLPALGEFTRAPAHLATELYEQYGPVAIIHLGLSVRPHRSEVAAPPLPRTANEPVLWVYLKVHAGPGPGVSPAAATAFSKGRRAFLMGYLNNDPHQLRALPMEKWRLTSRAANAGDDE